MIQNVIELIRIVTSRQKINGKRENNKNKRLTSSSATIQYNNLYFKISVPFKKLNLMLLIV